MGTFAENTEVAISKSREEIGRLLQKWGAAQIQWGDDFENGAALLRFVWLEKKSGARFQAKLVMRLQPLVELRKIAGETQWSRPHEGKLQKLMDARGKREHRVLLLWLKGAFEAIDLKLISAEELFLPWMEGADGRTVAEVALPGIGNLLAPGGMRLLLGPVGADR